MSRRRGSQPVIDDEDDIMNSEEDAGGNGSELSVPDEQDGPQPQPEPATQPERPKIFLRLPGPKRPASSLIDEENDIISTPNQPLQLQAKKGKTKSTSSTTLGQISIENDILPPKKKRVVLSDKQRRALCRKRQAGVSILAVAKKYGISDSTAKVIWQQKDKWLALRVDNESDNASNDESNEPKSTSSTTLGQTSIENDILPPKKKRVILSDKQRWAVCKERQAGKTILAVAKKYGISDDTVGRIWKEKDKWLALTFDNESDDASNDASDNASDDDASNDESNEKFLHPSLRSELSAEQLRVMNLYDRQQLTFAELADRMNHALPPSQQRSVAHYRQVYWSSQDIYKAWSSRDTLARYTVSEALAQERQQSGLTAQGPRDYEDVPNEILRHMARQRGLVVGGGDRYGDVLFKLLEDDALQGIAPLRPRALDLWSDVPVTHDPLDLKRLAAKNRRLLEAHRAQHEQDPAGVSERLNVKELLFKKQPPSVFTANLVGKLHKLKSGRARRTVPPSLLQQLLWYINAREGFDPPTYRSTGNTRLHGLNAEELKREARRAGISLPESVTGAQDSEDDPLSEEGRTRSDKIREFLVAQGASSEHVESLTRQDLDAILGATTNLPDAFGANTIRTVNDPSLIARSHNERLVGPRQAYTLLENHTRCSLFPGNASTRGLFCASDTLAQAFHATRSMYERHPPRLTFNDLMGLRFQHWNPHMQDLEPGTDNALTPDFDMFLRNHLQNVMGLNPGDPAFNEELDSMSTINMGQVGQVYVSLMFLQETVRRRYGESGTYALGVVTAGATELHPAQVYTLGEVTDTTRMVFIHNDNAEAQLGEGVLGHWSPFIQYGDNVDLIDSWGLHRLGAAELPSMRRDRRAVFDLTMEDKLTRARDTDSERTRRRKGKCLNCQERNCNCSLAGRLIKSRKAGERCKECNALGVECEFDKDVRVQKDITAADLMKDTSLGHRHDIPDPDWDIICEGVKLCKAIPAVPSGKKFALHIHSTRLSSLAAIEYFDTLVSRLPLIRMRVNNYLNSPAAQAQPPVPEARRPGAHNAQGLPNWDLQFYGMVTQRRGLLPWPARDSNNLADPYLVALIAILDSYEYNYAPLPEEIIITTSGFAGATVPVSGFGNLTGFLGRLKDIDRVRHSSLAANTDLMSIVASHAHHGHPHSIPAAIQGYFQLEHSKYLFRNNLSFLVARFAEHQLADATNAVAPLAFNGDQALANRLDAHLLLLNDEYAWRAHWLSDNTAPTALAILLRNIGRNGAWRAF